MNLNKQEMLELLKREVAPALGCTEPVCAALAAAGAANALGDAVERLCLCVSPGLYKNGMAVGIPGFDKTGLSYAAAIGALIARPEKELEIFSGLTPDIADRACSMAESGMCTVKVDESRHGVYACAEAFSGKNHALCLIEGGHKNIVLIQKNGETLMEKPAVQGVSDPLYSKLCAMSLPQLRQLVGQCAPSELEWLLQGAAQNRKLSLHGRQPGAGIGIAAALSDMCSEPLLSGSVLGDIMTDVAAAVESRMDGCPLSVMSSAGSGNQGLITTLTITDAAKSLGCTPEATAQALAFAHLLNIYIKQFIGKLSPICVCALSSCASNAAAVTMLSGGTDEQIGMAVINVAGDLTGMICDGGKTGCALKLITACSTALLCAGLAVRGVVVPATNGICARSAEQTIRNMGRVSEEGLRGADAVILSIMTEKAAQ